MTIQPRTTRAQIAFYAPMKPPDHPNPSGDRHIARLTLQALARAGFDATCVSRLRCLDMTGDPAAQATLRADARAESARLMDELAADPPALWFTYHCYYKAPDLLGPTVSKALGIPYVISEASISPKRRSGPWAGFATRSQAAITRADRLFWTTARDHPALEAAGHSAKMIHLPAFVDPGPALPPRAANNPLKLLTVAMMRPGDKQESYRRLAVALNHLPGEWQLTVVGHGTARKAALAVLAPFKDRLIHIDDINDSSLIRPHYEAADLMIWPGVNEGVGMAWLEAQAAGLPVIAEDGPAARAVIGGGVLPPPDDPHAFAKAIIDAAANRPALSRTARARVEEHHSLDAAAATLKSNLAELLP
jgi:glycosyltransferase involved in cell wall biosynthesis